MRGSIPHLAIRATCGSALVLFALASVAFAADNQATGDIGGDATMLVDSNIFTLDSTGSQLALVKRVYLPSGTRVPTGSTLPRGSLVDFLIYVSNDSAVQVNDLNVQDTLDPAFDYQAGTIRVDDTVGSCGGPLCAPATEDSIHSITSGRTPLNDNVDADVASYSAGTSTIDVGDESLGNARLDLAPLKVWAVVFTVQVN